MITIYLKGPQTGQKTTTNRPYPFAHTVYFQALHVYFCLEKQNECFTFLHKKHDFKSKEKLTIFSSIVFIQIYFQTSGKNRVSKHKLFVRFFAVVTALRSAFKRFTATNNIMYRRV